MGMLFNTFFGIACFSLALLQSAACNPAATGQNNAIVSKTVVASPTPPKNSGVVGAKGDQGKMDLLTEKVLAKDPTATLLAKQIGPSAAASLKPLAKNEDPVVREIALRSMEQSGGEGIADDAVKDLRVTGDARDQITGAGAAEKTERKILQVAE